MKFAAQVFFGGILLAMVLSVAGALGARANSPAPGPAAVLVLSPAAREQGCVNQGDDRRKFGTAVCWLQRQLSWKSEQQPHMMFVGDAQHRHLGLAWPPYVVYNAPIATGGWFMFRVGFRYDRVWRGYIFPTLAIKNITAPLTY